MNAPDAFLFVAELVGWLAGLCILAAVISDYAWPWIDGLWRARCARPQATYKSRKA